MDPQIQPPAPPKKDSSGFVPECVVTSKTLNLGVCIALVFYVLSFIRWRTRRNLTSGGSRGGQIRPCPSIEIGNGVWPPSGTERAMVVLWFCWKVRNLDPPPLRCRLQIWPPYGKIPYKTRKRSMTKKILLRWGKSPKLAYLGSKLWFQLFQWIHCCS